MKSAVLYADESRYIGDLAERQIFLQDTILVADGIGKSYLLQLEDINVTSRLPRAKSRARRLQHVIGCTLMQYP